MIGQLLIQMRLAAGPAIQGIQRLTGAVNGLATSFNAVGRALSSTNPLVNTATHSYRGLVGQVVSLNRFLNGTLSAIRQVGQGLQNFGVVFSLFISTPIAGFIAGITKELIDFDEQMVEVRKTTDLWGESLERVRDGILSISSATPTRPSDLAQIGAELGRAGIRDGDMILQLIEHADKIQQATTLNADNVIKHLTRVLSIYRVAADDYADEFGKLGDVINELGQANPINEDELLATAQRLAPQASLLGFSLPELFGYSATLAGTAASPERAATQMASAMSSVIAKFPQVATAMGLTNEQMRELINQDPAGFFFDMAVSIDNLSDNVVKSAINTELFGQVGGKAMGALASAYPDLQRNIDLANKAFEEGTSVQREYERSLDAVRAQIGILRNNLTRIGFIFGEAVLPQITKMVSFLIPALQMLGDAFDKLSDKQKLLAVGFALLSAAIGPLIIFLGTFLFTLGIIGTGISTMVATVTNAFVGMAGFITKTVGLIISAIFALFSWQGVLVAVLASTVVAISATLGGATTMIGSFVQNMFGYGVDLIQGFIGGIQSMAGALFSTIGAIFNELFVLFDLMSSPPTAAAKSAPSGGKDPLDAAADIGKAVRDTASAIDSYPSSKGDDVVQNIKSLADTIVDSARRISDADLPRLTGEVFSFINGMRPALSSLSSTGLEGFADIFGQIRGVVSAVGSAVGAESEQINEWIQKSASVLKDFFAALDSGGRATLEGLRSILGDFTGDFEKLIGYQNEYVRVSKKLEDVKKELEGIDDALRDQIMAIASRTDLSLAQRSSLIRRAKLDAAERKRNLEDQRDELEEEKDIANQRVDSQKSLISALEALIFPDTKKKEKAPKVEGDITGQILDIQDVGTTLDFADAQALVNAQTQTFLDKLQRGRQIIQGFIQGLNGVMPSLEIWETLPDEFKRGFESGSKIRTEILGFLDDFKLKLDGAKGAIDEIKETYDIFVLGIKEGLEKLYNSPAYQSFSELDSVFYAIGFAIGWISGTVDDMISKFLELMAAPVGGGGGPSTWDLLLFALYNIAQGFLSIIGMLSDVDELGEAIGALLFGLTHLFVALLNIVGFVARVVGPILGIVAESILLVLQAIGLGLELAVALYSGELDKIPDILTRLQDRIAEHTLFYTPFWESLFTPIGNYISYWFADLEWQWQTAMTAWATLANQFGANLPTKPVAPRPRREDFFTPTPSNTNPTGATSIGAPLPLDLSTVPTDILQQMGTADAQNELRRRGVTSGSAAGPRLQLAQPDLSASVPLQTPSLFANLSATAGGLTQGLEEQLSKLNTTEIEASINEQLAKIGLNTLPASLAAGTQIGTGLTDGLIIGLSGEEADQSLDTLPATIEAWKESKTEDFNKTGTVIAEDITGGVSTQLSKPASYMNGMLSSMSIWASSDNTQRSMKVMGWNIGIGIVTGIIDAIRASYKTISDVIDGVEFFRENGYNPVYPTLPVPPVGYGPSVVPDIAPSNTKSESNSELNFNISIEGGSIEDRKKAEAVADIVYNRIKDDIRKGKI